MFVNKIKANYSRVKRRLSKNSCETLFWLINFLPTLGGYSFFKNKITAPFWILHTSLSFYTYIVGTIMYNKYYAKEVVDYVNSFLNLAILLLIINADCWTLLKRFSIQYILKLVKENDDLAKESGRFAEEHSNKLRNIKWIVLATFTFHFVNDVLIFSTSRIMDVNDIIIASCTGLNPLSGSPKSEICKFILTLQEFTAIVVVGTYDVTLIFLTTHTTAICDLLRLEIASISQIADDAERDEELSISNRLKDTIYRHAKILETVKKLQNLYSVPIGLDFGNYAISILIFFVLPLDICLKFGPLVSHNLIVFFLYCLLGQRLTTSAEKIEMAIYSCGWENFSTKDRKTVLIMLRQAQKPVVLFAAEIVPICINTFANAMQMIFKFVTVFKV